MSIGFCFCKCDIKISEPVLEMHANFRLPSPCHKHGQELGEVMITQKHTDSHFLTSVLVCTYALRKPSCHHVYNCLKIPSVPCFSDVDMFSWSTGKPHTETIIIQLYMCKSHQHYCVVVFYKGVHVFWQWVGKI